MASTYKVIQGQNLYDVCVQLYGNLSRLYQLISDNTFIDSWSYQLQGGEEVLYHPELYNIIPREVYASAEIASTTTSITGQDRQSIYDILILSYGRMEDLMKLLQANGISNADIVEANEKTFIFDKSEIDDIQQYNALTKIARKKLATLYVATSQYSRFVLMESDGYVLLENGDKIELE